MEQAVVRETWEETKIRLDPESVTYIGSQAWPFPQSSMVGFVAEADATQTIRVDPDEILDAQWFSRDQVLQAASWTAEDDTSQAPLLIPPQGVIARRLIEHWLAATAR